MARNTDEETPIEDDEEEKASEPCADNDEAKEEPPPLPQPREDDSEFPNSHVLEDSSSFVFLKLMSLSGI